jgi:hypothetical protein
LTPAGQPWLKCVCAPSISGLPAAVVAGAVAAATTAVVAAALLLADSVTAAPGWLAAVDVAAFPVARITVAASAGAATMAAVTSSDWRNRVFLKSAMSGRPARCQQRAAGFAARSAQSCRIRLTCPLQTRLTRA